MTRFLFCLLITCFSIFDLRAQVLFEQMYSAGSNPLIPNGILQEQDGGYWVSGGINLDGPQYSDIFLTRLDHRGKIQWAKTYGGFSIESGAVITHAQNGNLVMAGITDDFTTGGQGLFLMNLDTAGNTYWSRVYGGMDSWEVQSILTLEDVGYAIVGHRTGLDGDRDAFVIATDSVGDTLWTRILGKTGQSESFISADLDPFGNMIVAGATHTTFPDFFVAKITPAGVVEWGKTYGDSQYADWCYNVRSVPAGGFVLCGYRLNAANEQLAMLLRINSDGDTLWSRTFRGAQISRHYDVLPLQDGSFGLVGNLFTTPVSSMIHRVDSLGFPVSCQAIQEMNGHFPLIKGKIMFETGNGLLVYAVRRNAGNDQRLLLVQATLDGDFACSSDPCGLSLVSMPIVVDTLSEYSTGITLFQGNFAQSSLAITLDSLCPSVLLSAPEPSETAFSVFPNPANDLVEIVATSPEVLSLKVFDTHGRLLVEKPFRNAETLSTDEYPNGLYLISLEGVNTRKYSRLLIHHR